MKLFIIGATGRTGNEVLIEAIKRGHEVTALVRTPAKVTIESPKLTIKAGNPLNEMDVVEAISGHDAVLSLIGPIESEVFKPSTVMEKGAASVVSAMKKAGLQKIVILSAAALFSGLLNSIFRRILRHVMRDSLAMENIVKESGLDWTITRPPRLTMDQTTSYRSRDEAMPSFGFTISRRAVAIFMLDVIEQKTHSRKTVGISK